MKKIAIIAFSTLLAVGLLGCSAQPKPQEPAPKVSAPGKIEAPAPSTQSPTRSAQTAKVQPTPEMVPQLVTIQSFSYRPANLTVKKGTSVKWVNNDGVPHTVTSDAFQSGVLNQGNFFQYTFNEGYSSIKRSNVPPQPISISSLCAPKHKIFNGA